MSKSKVANKVTGLQEFLDSLSKPEMQMGGKQPESFGSRKIKTVSVSPDRNYKTIVREKMGPDGGSTSVTNRRTVKGLMGGAPKPTKMKNGGMNIMNEAMDNATPSIPNSYYKMGGKKEMNPLSSMLPKKSMKSMKPKMGVGGTPPNAFGLNLQPLLKTPDKKQSLKKGGMSKKKNC